MIIRRAWPRGHFYADLTMLQRKAMCGIICRIFVKKLRYGARIYFIIHYFLADNSVEINEAHCRNSGRDSYPVSASDVEEPDTIQILRS